MTVDEDAREALRETPRRGDPRRADPFRALGDLPRRVNVASHLWTQAAAAPERAAVIAGDGKATRTTTFAELRARAARVATGLAAQGVARGDRVCVFVRPGVELLAVTWGLFALGAVPVLADPGMGREALLACIERTRPRVLVGVPRAMLARRLFPKPFASVELAVTVGRRWLWRGPTLDQVEAAGVEAFEPEDTAADELAAILFTSGSTGPPKGVEYTHGMFDAQVRALRATYGFEPGEVDLCCLPVFALFDAAFGMTSVFPPLDPSRPASVDPAALLRTAREHGCTTTFGSPAIWRKVVPWCHENGYKLDGFRRALVAGAPVPIPLLEAFHAVLPMDADVHTPYGATEGLPVCTIGGREVAPALKDFVLNGAGTPVGFPAPGIDLRLIRITDGPIERWSDDLEVPLGQPGEVVVRGPVVTHAYADLPDATRRAKIASTDPDSPAPWHRMGDLGRLDDEGRLWFLGRKAHRIETREGLRCPVPAENVFNQHPRVHRTALVGVGERGAEVPLLVVEPVPGELPDTKVMTEAFIMQLRTIGRKTRATADVELFLFHPGFPVDVRHNAKIHREELKAWAEGQLA